MSKKFTARQLDDYDIRPVGNMDIWAEDVSDGYHTFTELYEHRYALFAALAKVISYYERNRGTIAWKSKLHNDGTMFEDSFVAGIEVNTSKKIVQITYHFPLRLWSKLDVVELKKAPPYDGHTPDDVIKRLYEL